jgi:phage gp36-like protein
MPYCTQADIINLELPEKDLILLTDDPGLGSVTTAMVTAAIAKADAEIDAYCQSSYTVPFGTVPTIVTGWSATLSAFNLYRNRPKPTTLVDRYNKVMSWLSAVAKGERAIPGVTESSYSQPGSTTSGVAPTFTRTQRDEDGTIIGDVGTTETW